MDYDTFWITDCEPLPAPGEIVAVIHSDASPVFVTLELETDFDERIPLEWPSMWPKDIKASTLKIMGIRVEIR